MAAATFHLGNVRLEEGGNEGRPLQLLIFRPFLAPPRLSEVFLIFSGRPQPLDIYLRYPGKTDGWRSGRRSGGGGCDRLFLCLLEPPDLARRR